MARALGESVADMLADCINVAMVGLKGRGKTQTEGLLARDAIDAGHSALVVSWAEWVVVFDGPQYRAEVKQARVQGTLARIRQAAGRR